MVTHQPDSSTQGLPVAVTSPPLSKPSPRPTPYRPFLFVIVMFAVWFLFDLLARVVLTCMPGGDVCVLKMSGWPLQWLVFPAQHPAEPFYLYNHWPIDLLVSVLTLFLAIWAVSTVVFPDDLTYP